DSGSPPAHRASANTRGAVAREERADLVVRAEQVRLSYRAAGLFLSEPGPEVLKGIDLELRRGETLGLVGESGCGKSTLARVISGLIPMSAGKVTLLGHDLASIDQRSWQALRRQVQLVFQNPY